MVRKRKLFSVQLGGVKSTWQLTVLPYLFNLGVISPLYRSVQSSLILHVFNSFQKNGPFCVRRLQTTRLYVTAAALKFSPGLKCNQSLDGIPSTKIPIVTQIVIWNALRVILIIKIKTIFLGQKINNEGNILDMCSVRNGCKMRLQKAQNFSRSFCLLHSAMHNLHMFLFSLFTNSLF